MDRSHRNIACIYVYAYNYSVQYLEIFHIMPVTNHKIHQVYVHVVVVVVVVVV